MIYIGNFSYNDTSEEHDNYCLMPCIVAADNAEEAISKFAKMFEKAHEDGVLEGATEIYMDSLVELEEAPSEAVVCQLQKIMPFEDSLASVTSVLPTDVDSVITAYAWGSDDEDDCECEEEACECECEGDCEDECECDCECECEEEESVSEEPFLVF